MKIIKFILKIKITLKVINCKDDAEKFGYIDKS